MERSSTTPPSRPRKRLALLAATCSLALLGLTAGGASAEAAPTAISQPPGAVVNTAGWVYYDWYPDSISCAVNGWYLFGQANIQWHCWALSNGKLGLYFWAD